MKTGYTNQENVLEEALTMRRTWWPSSQVVRDSLVIAGAVATVVGVLWGIGFSMISGLENRLIDRMDANHRELSNRIDSVEGGRDGQIDSLESGLNRRIDSLESGLNGRIDSLESGLNERIDSVESGLNRRIDSLESGLNGRIDSLESGLNGRIDSLESDMVEGFKQSHQRMDRIEGRMDERMDRIESDIDRIDSNIDAIEKHLYRIGSAIENEGAPAVITPAVATPDPLVNSTGEMRHESASTIPPSEER